jgi:DNA-binding NarL/FixJ family response regulator
MIHVGLIEDDVFIRKSIEQFLLTQEEFGPVSVWTSVEASLEQPANYPQVLLLDIELPGMSGLEGAFHIKKKYPQTEIIILTVHEDKERIFKALQAGASGYLIKSTSLLKISAAIKEVFDGGAPMTPLIAKKVIAYFAKPAPSQENENLEQLTLREREVSLLLIEGNTYKQVAYNLNISPDTVRQHIKNIYKKLQINSRVQLINEFRLL